MFRTLRKLGVGLLASTMLMTSTAAPSFAVEATESTTMNAPVIDEYPILKGMMDEEGNIAFMGDVPLNSDGSVNLDAIESVATNTVLLPPSSETEAPLASIAAVDYTIRYHWNDVRGWGVIVRAWQEDKINYQHNLTVDVPRVVTTNPNIEYYLDQNADGHTWIFRASFNRIQCGWYSCYVAETRVVRSVVSYRKLNDGKSSGLISAYCENYAKCPDWVKNAVNI